MRPFAQAPFAALAEAPRRPHPYLTLGAQDVTIRVDGEVIRVRYRELGSGRPLVLVHGLMTSGYSFRYVVEPLAARERERARRCARPTARPAWRARSRRSWRRSACAAPR